MRFPWVMLAMLVVGLACEKDPSASNGSNSNGTIGAIGGGTAKSVNAPPTSVKDPSSAASTAALSAAALSTTASSVAGAAPQPSPAGTSAGHAASSKADQMARGNAGTNAGEGNGEPMDDVDDVVSATDKSGVDDSPADNDDSEGGDIKVEE